MYYNEHNPPHLHAEYQGSNAIFDFSGNIVKGSLSSKTATRLVRDWIDLHALELENDWTLAQSGKELKNIEPLD
jgi:hypothetical protein